LILLYCRDRQLYRWARVFTASQLALGWRGNERRACVLSLRGCALRVHVFSFAGVSWIILYSNHIGIPASLHRICVVARTAGDLDQAGPDGLCNNDHCMDIKFCAAHHGCKQDWCKSNAKAAYVARLKPCESLETLVEGHLRIKM
jgi:hypothetical protein